MKSQAVLYGEDRLSGLHQVPHVGSMLLNGISLSMFHIQDYNIRPSTVLLLGNNLSKQLRLLVEELLIVWHVLGS